MKESNNRITTIKKASFNGMLKRGAAFVFINFLVISFFVMTLVFKLISSNEIDLANQIVSNITEKQDRVKNTSDTLAKFMAGDFSEKERREFIGSIMESEDKTIAGILILNNDGIVTMANESSKGLIGEDLSRRDFFGKVLKSNLTVVSDPYVSYKDKKVTTDVVSPIIKSGKLGGMIVTITNPRIIQSDKMDGSIEYYVVNHNGDIVFNSRDNMTKLEDNIYEYKILDRARAGDTKPLLYKNNLNNKWTLGVVRDSNKDKTYVLVENYIFENGFLFKGFFIVFALALIMLFMFMVFMSVRVSNVVTKYINIFKNQLSKISKGSYDLDIAKQYRYEEINDVIEIFINMSDKVKHREEELQAYNEELIAANDEIRTMLTTINKNEKEKKEQYVQIIWTLLNFLEMKDEYTAGHSRTVTTYAEKIAEKLNKNYGFRIDVEKIQVASSLHDIGKIGISADILRKPSRLTNEEFETIKTHPAKGYYALENIQSLKDERKMIRYHHERYDGKGYPDGIRGDSIPLGARIICVADAFDAMISDRPYRKGMSVDHAVDELRKNKGTQFDPLIVDVFIQILKENDFNILKETAIM